MTNSTIFSFQRNGAWSSSYSFHYECAWMCFYEYQNYIVELSKAEKDLRASLNVQEEYLEGFVRHETDHLHMQAYRAATSAHLFACMAIEGFINHYGTVRLGEEAYKALLERMGITEKLSLIYLLCFEKKVLIADSPIKQIRKLFDQRNSLVHPKTKELTPDNMASHIYVHPSKLSIKDSMEILESFIDNICGLDHEISRDFNFKKPAPLND